MVGEGEGVELDDLVLLDLLQVFQVQAPVGGQSPLGRTRRRGQQLDSAFHRTVRPFQQNGLVLGGVLAVGVVRQLLPPDHPLRCHHHHLELHLLALLQHQRLLVAPQVSTAVHQTKSFGRLPTLN